MPSALPCIAIALGAVVTLAILVAAIEGHRKRKEPVMDEKFREWLRRVDAEVFGECK